MVNTNVSSNDIHELKKKLVKQLLASVAAGTMTSLESRESAAYILKNIGSIKTSADIQTFLQNLVKQWRVYEPVLKEYTIHSHINEDTKKIENIKAKLMKFT